MPAHRAAIYWEPARNDRGYAESPPLVLELTRKVAGLASALRPFGRSVNRVG